MKLERPKKISGKTRALRRDLNPDTYDCYCRGVEREFYNCSIGVQARAAKECQLRTFMSTSCAVFRSEGQCRLEAKQPLGTARYLRIITRDLELLQTASNVVSDSETTGRSYSSLGNIGVSQTARSRSRHRQSRPGTGYTEVLINQRRNIEDSHGRSPGRFRWQRELGMAHQSKMLLFRGKLLLIIQASIPCCVLGTSTGAK